ncbi:hypothetical protein [Streptomyces blattellae]|uniref:hypothetical protein n=1 Tax=Streptomyces blattellae TaxID=2569855 RepID=UPI0012B9A215|nr:hypothetical protein [Streptomyces blattellae]
MNAVRTWSRVLVLLLALLVPGEHTAHAAVITAETSSAVAAECDDTVLRSAAARPGRRTAAPLRPAPRQRPAPSPAIPPPPEPARTEPALNNLRTVVLRC